MHPHLFLSGVFLLLALGLAAAFFFPPLLFVFLLKRKAAALAVPQVEANKKFAQKVGRIAAPLLACATLAAAVYFYLQWKEDLLRQATAAEQIRSQQEEKARLLFAQSREPLLSFPLREVYFDEERDIDNTPLLQLSDQEKVSVLLREIAEALTPADIRLEPDLKREENLWQARYFQEGGRPMTYTLNPFLDRIEITDYLTLGGIKEAERQPVVIKVPENFRSRFAELKSLAGYPRGLPPPPPPVLPSDPVTTPPLPADHPPQPSAIPLENPAPPPPTSMENPASAPTGLSPQKETSRPNDSPTTPNPE